MTKCPLCDKSVDVPRKDGLGAIFPSILEFNCPRCGDYIIDEAISKQLGKINFKELKEDMFLLSGYSRELHHRGGKFKFIVPGFDYFHKIEELKKMTVQQKIDKLFNYLSVSTKNAGDLIGVNESNDYPITFSRGRTEFNFIMQSLIDEGFVVREGNLSNEYACKITARGWLNYEREKNNELSNKVFIAGWFAAPVELWDSIRKAVRDAGYEPDDLIMAEHLDDINSRIMAGIREARFVIADFTCDSQIRGGVYYEAGFAKGLGLQVIWTCREDMIEKLHFDINHYPFKKWSGSNWPEFQDGLKNSILELFGPGENREI